MCVDDVTAVKTILLKRYVEVNLVSRLQLACVASSFVLFEDLKRVKLNFLLSLSNAM